MNNDMLRIDHFFVFVSDPRQNKYFFFFFYGQLLQSGAPLLGLAKLIFILV